MRRAVVIFLLALPLLVVGAEALLWRSATQRLAAGFAAWEAARRAQGWEARAGAPVAGGWPLAATVTVPAVFLAGGEPDIPGGLTFSADRVVLRVALLQPRTLVVAVEGMQRLRLSGRSEIPYTADRLAAELPLEAGVPERRADITAINLRAGLPAGRSVTSGLTIARLDAQLEWKPAAPEGEAALALRLRAEDVGLPPPAPGAAWPLGSHIASVSAEGGLNGPLPKSGGGAGGHGLVPRATLWRDGGGTIDLHNLAVGWGPMGLDVTATLTLDEDLQPMGTGTAKLVGYGETMDALVAGGAVGARTALAAKAVLALIARAPDGGGPAEVEVPLTLRDRTLSMRQVPLAHLPELLWPKP